MLRAQGPSLLHLMSLDEINLRRSWEIILTYVRWQPAVLTSEEQYYMERACVGIILSDGSNWGTVYILQLSSLAFLWQVRSLVLGWTCFLKKRWKKLIQIKTSYFRLSRGTPTASVGRSPFVGSISPSSCLKITVKSTFSTALTREETLLCQNYQWTLTFTTIAA